MRGLLKGVTQRLLGAAARAVDDAATIAVSRDTLKFRARHSTGERLRAIFDFADEWAELKDNFDFAQPVALSPLLTEVRGGQKDLRWNSDYTAFFPQHSAMWASSSANQTASARVVTLTPARPTVVIVHGYLAGQYALEQRIWPIERLNELGLNVVLFTLPFHGVRLGKGERRGFPTKHPRENIEGLRQAVFDLGNLVRWLRQAGCSKVGVAGMSLGSYVSSLLATTTAELDFLVTWVPLASFADFALEQHQLGEDLEARARAHQTLERVYAKVSPLERTPCIAKGKTLVVGARADRITPITHAQRLARHFQAPLHSVPGGHLLQVGRAEGFSAMEDFLRGARIL
ncbi:MAG: hypothetical protein SFV15_15600 [Polyangiaceae bacterium]|nr:hypothetical protein [Polyangiaceae bacterium]